MSGVWPIFAKCAGQLGEPTLPGLWLPQLVEVVSPKRPRTGFQPVASGDRADLFPFSEALISDEPNTPILHYSNGREGRRTEATV